MVRSATDWGSDWTNILSRRVYSGESSLTRWENSSPLAASLVASWKEWIVSWSCWLYMMGVGFMGMSGDMFKKLDYLDMIGMICR